jgi:acetoin utilization deacetylase AcuC-like enzyme
MSTAYVTHPLYADHDYPGHPEHAGRIRAVWRELESSGLTARMTPITPREVSDADILAVHGERYLDRFNWIGLQEVPVFFDPDTYALPETPQIARLAAGGVVAAVDAVLSGSARNAMACVRPPGHHALAGSPMGFCLLGNVPIAVRHAQRAHGLKRVLVVDYDVHHGNGTQDMFYNDGSVLFISSHQSPFYPGTGLAEETGAGQGRGATLNIPLPAGVGDVGFAQVYERVVWPAARAFRPELIVVSAGFDAHWRDPLGGLTLTNTGYAHLTRELIRMANELCGGRIVFAMEGGYDTEALSAGWRNIAHALLGDRDIYDPIGKRNTPQPEPDIRGLIDYLCELHMLMG